MLKTCQNGLLKLPQLLQRLFFLVPQIGNVLDGQFAEFFQQVHVDRDGLICAAPVGMIGGGQGLGGLEEVFEDDLLPSFVPVQHNLDLGQRVLEALSLCLFVVQST